MLIYPQDLNLLGLCVIIPALFELFRLVLGYFIAAPPSAIRKLEKQKLELHRELSSIKSVQVELVRHSKLERQVIKLDKELEALRSSLQPKTDKFKKQMKIVRVVVYIAASVYLGLSAVVQISPSTLWPFSWISSEDTIALHPWFVLMISAAALRHAFRSVSLVLFPGTNFP